MTGRESEVNYHRYINDAYVITNLLSAASYNCKNTFTRNTNRPISIFSNSFMRLPEINSTNTVVYSTEPCAEVNWLQLNFKILKLANKVAKVDSLSKYFQKSTVEVHIYIYSFRRFWKKTGKTRIWERKI